MIATILIAATQAFFVATVATFGCTSDEEVTKLDRLRSSKILFDHELYNEVFLGHCVIIGKGTTVEGTLRDTVPGTILVDRSAIPPGYIAPSNDLEPFKTEQRQFGNRE